MKKIHYAWRILASCCALEFAVLGMTASTMGIYLVPVSETLGAGVGQLSIYSTIQNIVMMLLCPIAGKMLMKYNLSIVVSLAVVGLCGVLGMMSQAASVIHFYVAGALLGICYSFIMFLTVPLLINNWFQKKVGVAMGIALSFSGVGGSLSSLTIGAVMAAFGWRAAYRLTAICVAVVVLPFCLFVIRRSPEEMGLLPYGATEFENEGYCVQEVSNIGPTTGPSVPPNITLWFLLIFGCMMGLLSAMQSNISVFANSLGLPMQNGATASAVLMAAVIVAKLILGATNDRLGVFSTVNIACAVAAAAVIIWGISNTGDAYLLFTGAALYGFTIAMSVLQPPMLTRTLFGAARYGEVYPKIQQAYSFASAVALPLYNFIYDRVGTYRPVLLLLSVALVGIVGCGLAIRHCTKVHTKSVGGKIQ